MPNPITYQYFAFISFQNSDAREALKLQKAIENYRLPAVLCRHDKSIPRRVRPCFCYLNDIHAGEELMTELKSRMEQSRYLIVVCSPRAAKSAYVNSGIDYFISLGRRDSIIPIIVDGIPYSNDPETECFPEALRRHFPKHADPLQDHSILGINLREAGAGSRLKTERRAMLMVVARMLELDFDGLLLRDRERQRKRRIGIVALLVAICAALTMTWQLSQAVDVPVVVEEQTPANNYLPPLQDMVISVQLGSERKTDTVHTLRDTALLRHVPPRFVGQQVALQLQGKDIVAIDTTLELSSPLTIPLRRDADVYGKVHFRLRGVEHPERIKLKIASRDIYPDEEGNVELHIPIEEQRVAYEVHSAVGSDSLYMPCGEDDIIVL